MYWLAARFGLAGTIRGLGGSEGVRGTRECVQGLGKGRWDWTRRFVHYCVELLFCVSFLADLVVCLSVSLELRLPCFLCAFRGSAPERAQ